MKKVVITGASGFIGKALTKHLLDKGVQVWAIVRDKNKIQEFYNYKNINIIEAEFCWYQELEKLVIERTFDCFYHVAWDGMYGESFADYAKQINNIRFTCDAFESSRKLQCKKFVFVGTVGQYEVRKYIEHNINDLRITTIYGMSKLTAEMVLKTLANKYNDIELNIVHLAKVYGEGDNSRTITRVLLETLLKGESPKLSVGEFLYDWIYVGDVAKGMAAVGKYGINKKSYYVGHRKIERFKDIVRKVGAILAPNIKLRFGEYTDSASIDYSKINLDDLYNDTGFEAQSDFKESILKTAQWIKKSEELL